MRNDVNRGSGPDIVLCGGCESLASEIVEWGAQSIAICETCKSFLKVSFLTVHHGKSQDLSRQEVGQIVDRMISDVVRYLTGPDEVTPVLIWDDDFVLARL